MLSSSYYIVTLPSSYCGVGLLSACYNVMFFVVLLQHFIYMGAIEIGKVDSISRRYHITIINILKNLSHRYYNHYIIKFIGFMPIYYAINLNFVSYFMVFSNMYFEFINLLQI